MIMNATHFAVVVTVALICIPLETSIAQETSLSNDSAISADQIKQLIADLDDDRFHVRESALRRLSAADASVIPRLADAAADGSMEVVVRAISAMRNIAARDHDASLAVQAELVRLSQPAYTLAGRHAARALQELMVIEGERARSELLALGAKYGNGSNTGNRAPIDEHLEFTGEWRGTAADFSKIKILQDIQFISLIGANFDDEYLADLLTIPNPDQIYLYNTKFSDAAVAKLRAEFGERLDYRVGAKLGVTSNSGFAVRCMIFEVVAGSAADKAGMMPGDIVTSADGTPIQDFDALNAIIAKKSPGDELKLEITRNQRRLTVTATLDGW